MCQIVDFSLPQDPRVQERQSEQFEKFQDLAREIKRIWQAELKVITHVVGPIGTIQRAMKANLEEIGMDVGIDQLQKSVLLGTATILRKVLNP